MNSPAPHPATSSAGYPWPYHAIDGHYDELIDASGQTRPAWQKLMQELTAVGTSNISERWEHTRRFIHENGVTYNVYGDHSGMYRPWQLDAVPMMISAQEWVSIEQAISQRAMLLNQVIADAYGDQRLIKENHLPPELILANPGFLRPACGIATRNNLWLHIYAADLARAPNGQWWVIWATAPRRPRAWDTLWKIESS